MVILSAILYAYVLWLLFLAVMALRWRWRSLSLPVRIIAAPVVVAAIILDVLFNFTVGCVVFLKFPAKGEWTFSQRVGNYKRRIDWRAPLATCICTNLLDPFEMDGAHCKKG